MKNEQFEYYLIGSDKTPSVPLLMPDDNQDTMMLHGREPITGLDKPMKLCFRPPVPAKPRIVDFHELPSPVFSQKIYDILYPLNIYGLQLLPATIKGKDKNYYRDYWVAYVYNRITCLDMEHSKYEISKLDGKVKNILQFFLDNEKLKKIPLEKRLVFLLVEGMSKRIYHKSVVDAVMSINPDGIKFYPIQEWHEGLQFKEEKW